MSMMRLSGFLVQSNLLCTSLIRSWIETSASSSLVFSVDMEVSGAGQAVGNGDHSRSEGVAVIHSTDRR